MITIEASPNSGYWLFNGLDLPQGYFGIYYDGDLDSEADRNFNLYNIYTNVLIIKSRHYSEIQGIGSWDELSDLLKQLSILAPVTTAVNPLFVNTSEVFY